MEEIKRYQVRGLPGPVVRVRFGERIVDYWAPAARSEHLLIAHDGQNIFDRKTATKFSTWKLAEKAMQVADDLGKTPPAVIAIFHGKTKIDPHGRARDLCPEDPFHDGIKPATPARFEVSDLRANSYLEQIFTEIVPEISKELQLEVAPARRAMIGSSLGGLATLYAAIRFSEQFHTALSLSPHWTLAGEELVDWMIPRFPNQQSHRIWMSRGTKGYDSKYQPLQNRADKLMRELGWQDQRFKSRIFKGAAHNERAWSRQIKEPLNFWLQD
ncbi:MAG: alpha/beta hydrolase [Actinomycetales bacterium]|jgi:enterochelin esterase-like enzyme